MFYIKEIFLRIFYAVLCIIVLFLVSWIKILCLQTCYLGYMMEIIQKFSMDQSIHFIYTAPFELFELNLTMCYIISLTGAIYLVIISTLDYLKSSLYLSEYFLVNFIILFHIFSAYVYINWFFYTGLTEIIGYIKDFSAIIVNLTHFNMFLELKLLDYVSFLNFCLAYAKKIYLFFAICFFFSGIFIFSTLLKFKPYWVGGLLIAITVISPPEILNQLILFFFICLLLEFYVFIICYKLVYAKQLVFNFSSL